MLILNILYEIRLWLRSVATANKKERKEYRKKLFHRETNWDSLKTKTHSLIRVLLHTSFRQQTTATNKNGFTDGSIGKLAHAQRT